MGLATSFVSGMARFKSIEGKASMLRRGLLTRTRIFKYANGKNQALRKMAWQELNQNPKLILDTLSEPKDERLWVEQQDFALMVSLLLRAPEASAELIAKVIAKLVIKKETCLEPESFHYERELTVASPPDDPTGNILLGWREKVIDKEEVRGIGFNFDQVKLVAKMIKGHVPEKQLEIFKELDGLNPELGNKLRSELEKNRS